MNTRRDFLKASAAAATAWSIAPAGQLLAADPTSIPKPVLVAVRDGTRTAMLDRALASLGGIGAFVRPGQTVAIKPNIGWDVPPNRGANTHPELVGHLVALCRAAGAKSVSVFDHPCDQWQRTYTNSGIEAAVRAAGGRLVNGKDEALYREVALPRGVSLKCAKVHALALDSDVFFNLPVLKHHSGTLMTAAIKNLMGVVWDRSAYHGKDLQQRIADFLTLRLPTLNILDAYHPMMRNGPRGRGVDDCVEKRMLLASIDPVLIDAAAARLLDHEPAAVTHVKLAADLRLGEIDLKRADVRRLSLA